MMTVADALADVLKAILLVVGAASAGYLLDAFLNLFRGHDDDS